MTLNSPWDPATTSNFRPDTVAVSGAVVGSGAEVGSGAVVGSGAEVGSGAVVGSGAEVGSGAVVGSGAEVGSGAVVAPGAGVASGAIVAGASVGCGAAVGRVGSDVGAKGAVDSSVAPHDRARMTRMINAARLSTVSLE